jgi:predicted regulator of Ras-like GTPase activity (Roadblock/LC7/MglB family)
VKLTLGRLLGKKVSDSPTDDSALPPVTTSTDPAKQPIIEYTDPNRSPPVFAAPTGAKPAEPKVVLAPLALEPVPSKIPATDKTPAQALAKRLSSAATHPQGTASAKIKEATKPPVKPVQKIVVQEPSSEAQPAASSAPLPSATATANPERLKLTPKEPTKMAVDLSKLQEITGFIGAAVVDSDSGMMLASIGGGALLDLEVAGAANTEVVKAKLRAMQALGLDDAIEDILITLGKQYHLIRPLANQPTTFIYVAVDRRTANLALARSQVRAVESTLKV